MATHYDLLGVECTASQEEIRAAYRSVIQRIHPDRNRGNSTFERLTQQVNAAYDVLSNSERRAAYDREQGIGASDPSSAGSERSYGNPNENNQRQASEVEFDIGLETVADGFREIYHAGGLLTRVEIPPGVENGERIPVTLSGEDVTLLIRVKPHPRFTRRGADLYTELSVKKVDAFNRMQQAVPILGTFRRYILQLKPEQLRGKHVRIPGYGLPFRDGSGQKGDLYVALKPLPIPDRIVEVTLAEVARGCHRRLNDFGDVAIPQGVAHGERIYLWNKGGAEANLTVNVAPHVRYTRRGDDLYTTARVSHAALLLRSTHRLKGAAEQTINLRLRPEYADGQQVRIPRQGLPNRRNPERRGDIYVTLETALWEEPSEELASRQEKLSRFTRRSTTATLKAIGVVNGFRGWIPTALMVLRILIFLAVIGFAIHCIATNLVLILILIGVAAAGIALLMYLLRAWEDLLIPLLALGVITGLVIAVFLVHCIIGNIVSIMIAMGASAAAYLLLLIWHKN